MVDGLLVAACFALAFVVLVAFMRCIRGVEERRVAREFAREVQWMKEHGYE